ncbi:hypothetical protein GRI97_17665 [Altererythrobacter xixiisoli]|uniref:Secreted protein n=1 Tax=Croceibacterium xixiisoli TaxID=1476466 RepID=A0A6I4TZR1_9SPHN|nr:hypothetical protein [Croceibacterium xixiisoli]MXP00821.1 hypothetical protein [Croceibacterium xixiisoli]
MTDPRKLGMFLGAVLLAVTPHVASAQQRCVTEAEVSAMTIYAVPSMVKSLQSRCAGRLSSTGFLATRGQQFAGRYAALQTTVWPRAKSGLLKIIASRTQSEAAIRNQNTRGLDMIGNLPDEAVRPFVDALIVQELTPQIDLANCSKIERAMQAVAPIDPEVSAGLVGLVVGLAQPKDISICPESGQ